MEGGHLSSPLVEGSGLSGPAMALGLLKRPADIPCGPLTLGVAPYCDPQCCLCLEGLPPVESSRPLPATHLVSWSVLFSGAWCSREQHTPGERTAPAGGCCPDPHIWLPELRLKNKCSSASSGFLVGLCCAFRETAALLGLVFSTAKLKARVANGYL